jgi:hypothetical protein
MLSAAQQPSEPAAQAAFGSRERIRDGVADNIMS